jgi:hypothetical protein
MANGGGSHLGKRQRQAVGGRSEPTEQRGNGRERETSGGGGAVGGGAERRRGEARVRVWGTEPRRSAGAFATAPASLSSSMASPWFRLGLAPIAHVTSCFHQWGYFQECL